MAVAVVRAAGRRRMMMRGTMCMVFGRSGWMDGWFG
jgi:hypothetical protein